MAIHYQPTARKHAGVTGNRKHRERLDRYAQARRDGIQPATTRPRDVDDALAISDKTQKPFRADATAREWDKAS